jgi:hypothetical protein
MSISQVSSRLGTFDTVLMMGGNFGLLRDFKTARRLLARFDGRTTQMGRIVAASLDPYDTDDPAHLDYHERNRRRGRMAGQVRIRARFERYRTPWFDYLFVSRDEMIAILNGTGWRVKRFIDSKGPRYVAIVEKDRR